MLFFSFIILFFFQKQNRREAKIIKQQFSGPFKKIKNKIYLCKSSRLFTSKLLSFSPILFSFQPFQQVPSPHLFISDSLLEGALDVSGHPIKALVETLRGGGAAALHKPVALAEGVKAELLGDVGGRHGLGKILLVGEHEEHGVAELVLGEHLLELITGLTDTIAIVGVDNEDDAVGVLEVVAPEGAELILASDVPHGELKVLVLYRLNIKTNSGNGGDDLAELELEEDGGLTGGIEANHKDTNLLFTEEVLESGHNISHGYFMCVFFLYLLF